MADDMDIHQTPLLDEEHKNLKSDCLEDDSFNPPIKRMKYFLPSEKPNMPVLGWYSITDFRLYTLMDVEVYEDIITKCDNEIKACESAIQAAGKFFDTEFGELKEKQRDDQSSDVVCYFGAVKELARSCIDTAHEIFPKFVDHVNKYITFRNGPLENLKDAKYRYFKNIMELAKKPYVVKILNKLHDDEDKKGGHTENNEKEIYDISFHLWKNTRFRYRREDAMNKEQDDESLKEDLLPQLEYEALKKDLITFRRDYEYAEGIVEEHIKNYYTNGVYEPVYHMEYLLECADSRVRIMRRQLELLVEKDVLRNGYDDDFDDEWLAASRPIPKL